VASPLKSDSNLESVLSRNIFAVTGELGPPRGADPDIVRQKAQFLKGRVDAVNNTDNQTAMARMASWAASLIALAMQSDILGAAALGVKTMLCLSGDHQSFGDHPKSKKVFDLDSVQLISMVKKMRDESKFLSGEALTKPPRIFIGAAENPFGEPYEFRAHRLAKKIAAGADFIQTQCIFNMERFREWIRQSRDMGLTEKVYILAGITPMKSLKMAQYMKSSVPGLDVPDWVIKRLEGVEKKKQADEGITIACEQIEELKQTKGVAGVHLMLIEWESRVPEITERAKLLPRPVVEKNA